MECGGDRPLKRLVGEEEVTHAPDIQGETPLPIPPPLPELPGAGAVGLRVPLQPTEPPGTGGALRACPQTSDAVEKVLGGVADL